MIVSSLIAINVVPSACNRQNTIFVYHILRLPRSATVKGKETYHTVWRALFPEAGSFTEFHSKIIIQ